MGLARLLAEAPAALRTRLSALWEEYEAGETAEARWVKALDKIETLMTHAEGANPPDFDYAFNLDYGRWRPTASRWPRRCGRWWTRRRARGRKAAACRSED
jgi:hypothetical protein